MFDENQYLWCFLFVAVIVMVMFRSYPMIFPRKKIQEGLKVTKRKVKLQQLPPKQEAIAQNRLVISPPQPTRDPPRIQAVQEGFQQPLNQQTMPPSYQSAGMDPRQIYAMRNNSPQPAITSRYESFSNPQEMPQYQSELSGMRAQYAPQGGPPPPMETNPRKQENSPNMASLMPQNGMATPQQELERQNLQNVATHDEAMSGDNFFTSGGLSPANGSEWGSPI